MATAAYFAENSWKNFLTTFGTIGVGSLALARGTNMYFPVSETLPPQIQQSTSPSPLRRTIPSEVVPRNAAIEQHFRMFADEWIAAVQNLSNVRYAMMHPAYHRILAMGVHALPYMFDDLADGNGAHWLPALEAITLGQVDPVAVEHREDSILMCEDWLDWWRGNEQSA